MFVYIGLLDTLRHNSFSKGGHATFLGFINLFVHALMYSYHFVIAYYPARRKEFEKYKIHLTQLQIVSLANGKNLYSKTLTISC